MLLHTDQDKKNNTFDFYLHTSLDNFKMIIVNIFFYQ